MYVEGCRRLWKNAEMCDCESVFACESVCTCRSVSKRVRAQGDSGTKGLLFKSHPTPQPSRPPARRGASFATIGACDEEAGPGVAEGVAEEHRGAGEVEVRKHVHGQEPQRADVPDEAASHGEPSEGGAEDRLTAVVGREFGERLRPFDAGHRADGEEVKEHAGEAVEPRGVAVHGQLGFLEGVRANPQKAVDGSEEEKKRPRAPDEGAGARQDMVGGAFGSSDLFVVLTGAEGGARRAASAKRHGSEEDEPAEHAELEEAESAENGVAVQKGRVELHAFQRQKEQVPAARGPRGMIRRPRTGRLSQARLQQLKGTFGEAGDAATGRGRELGFHESPRAASKCMKHAETKR